MSIAADVSRLQKAGRASTPDRPSSSPQGDSRTRAERLTDDLLVEILSRVPAKSLCRFKCVSNHWLGLADHPDHRKKLPQPLAGFLYSSSSRGRFLNSPVQFTSVPWSRCPPITTFAFLPSHRRIDVMDCCNGLLLCRWYGVSAQDDQFRYVVCSPATEQWVDFPNSGHATKQVAVTRLGFDPAQSSHFHVFELLEQVAGCTTKLLVGVAVYSSETGGWVYKEKRRNGRSIRPLEQAVFLNGHLYFHAFYGNFCVATVDTEGENWMNFALPGHGFDGFIQCSQGRLHYAKFYGNNYDNVIRLAVYVLEDYGSKKSWELKHTVETSELFGGMDVCYLRKDIEWVGIHPECNVIYLTADNTLMCYNMDHRQVKVIRELEDGMPPYLPYVPLYAELKSLHM